MLALKNKMLFAILLLFILIFFSHLNSSKNNFAVLDLPPGGGYGYAAGLSTASVTVNFKGLGADPTSATLGKYIYQTATVDPGWEVTNQPVVIIHFMAYDPTRMPFYRIGTYSMGWDWENPRNPYDTLVDNWRDYETLGDTDIPNDVNDGDIFFIADYFGITGFKISLAGTDPSGIYVDYSNNIIYINTGVAKLPPIPFVHNIINPWPSPPSLTFEFPDDHKQSSFACLTVPELSINGNILYNGDSCVYGGDIVIYQGMFGFDIKHPNFVCRMKEKVTGDQIVATLDGRTWDAGPWINDQIYYGYRKFTFKEKSESGACSILYKAYITASGPGVDDLDSDVFTGTKCP